MAQLKKEIKIFIVRSLAQFNTPTETAQAVHQEYGVQITKQNCEKYDPTKRSGQDLSAELRKEFEATRQDFLDKPQNIPISNLSYRQARRQKVLEGAGNNKMLIMSVLEQAAKDVGGVFTNRKEITGKDGKPLTEPVTPIELTPEVAAAITQALKNEY